MTRTDSRLGRTGLMVGHCAGMVDLVALPVWVGTLISQYRLSPQQAGGMVTLFLVGAVASSLLMAPLFTRVRGRLVAVAGFAVSAAAFYAISGTTNHAAMLALHLVGGMAAGAGLSVTHGTIGRSRNPHRLFALVNFALCVFMIFFLGATPKIVATAGGPALFQVFAGVMAVAAIFSSFAFPEPDAPEAARTQGGRIKREVWFGVVGVSCMALVQAMLFSFVERIGTDRGFGVSAITAVFIALGFVNLLPASLAALLEKRLSGRSVTLAGPVVQAALALTIAFSSSFAPFAVATALFASVVIFTHTFAFALLARLDTTGRVVAATPAMLMVGAATGPILGGTLVQGIGYQSLGIAAALIAVVAVTSFYRAQPRERHGVPAPAKV